MNTAIFTRITKTLLLGLLLFATACSPSVTGLLGIGLPAKPAGPEQAGTFTSSLYGYQVSVPAGWSVEVNTSVPAGPGENPEYVTFKADDPSNLPRIEIQALTGEAPMSGYEDCARNFVFRSLPACQISRPAGQNPATEIWVFENGQAHFFIAMQYEDPQALSLFDEFLTSFEFTD